MNETMDYDFTSAVLTEDARGLLCPEPVMRARIAINRIEPGQHLLLLADDPHAGLDLEVFCLRGGHQLLARRQQDKDWHFLLQRGTR